MGHGKRRRRVHNTDSEMVHTYDAGSGNTPKEVKAVSSVSVMWYVSDITPTARTHDSGTVVETTEW